MQFYHGRRNGWNGNGNHRASHDVFLPQILFLNIEKVLQNVATTIGKNTFFQLKSQAAKSKWAKIETGLSLGNRWEMFVLGWKGGKEETAQQLNSFGRFLAHWVSWLHQFKQDNLWVSNDHRPPNFLSQLFFLHIFSLNQHHRICFMWSFLWSQIMH